MKRLLVIALVTGCHASTNPGADPDAQTPIDAGVHDTRVHEDAEVRIDAPPPPIDAPFSSTEPGFAIITLSDATDFDDLTISAEVASGTEHQNACNAPAIHGCCVISTIPFVIQSSSVGTIEIDDGTPLATLVPGGFPVVYPTFDSTSGRRWTPGDHLLVSAPGEDLRRSAIRSSRRVR